MEGQARKPYVKKAGKKTSLKETGNKKVLRGRAGSLLMFFLRYEG